MKLHRVEIEVDAAMLVSSEQHQADLIREFQLISLGQDADAGTRPLPGRLADLIVETLADYTPVQNANLEAAFAALERGDTNVKLDMDLPVEVIPAIKQILAALEEADSYCRDSGALLTLATPPDIAELRRWFVDEVERQIEADLRGSRPTP